MLTVKFVSVLLTFFVGACTVGADDKQSNPSASHKSPSVEQESETSKAPCSPRPLNPDSTPKPQETELDQAFRLAYDAAAAGDFATAIANYDQAAEIAKCECDRRHAQSGKQAAEEAQEIPSKATQFFWIRLQDLTDTLPCVTQ